MSLEVVCRGKKMSVVRVPAELARGLPPCVAKVANCRGDTPALLRERQLQALLTQGAPVGLMQAIVPSDATQAEQFKNTILTPEMDGDLLALAGKLSDRQLRIVFHQVVQGVAWAHENCVAHADIKPDNLFFKRHASAEAVAQFPGYACGGAVLEVRLGDFGSAVCFGAAPSLMLGTDHYLAPELAGGDGSYAVGWAAAQADLWSLGATMWAMVVGSHPPRASQAASQASRVAEMLHSLEGSKASASLRWAIEGLLCVEPEKRYTCSDLLCSTLFEA